ADVDEQKIRSIVGDYVGDLYQRPPLRASVKRVLRIRTVYSSEILDIKKREVLFRVSCQAGFYVRKYCHDIGQSLGCGAHMKELRRTRAGPFVENTFLSTLQELYDAYAWHKEENDENPLRNIILPMEYGVQHVPKIIIKDSAVDTICHGAPLALPGVTQYSEDFKAGDMVAIYTLKNELIALGEAQLDAKTLPEKESGLVSSTKRVLMTIGTYPSSPKK
ncbi:MAG: RNA-guided pseudouridylation complex pseudouridine synthase subunit Cbf5, partial [Candidatus Heimdallarchaeota archaeon]|nr:RNA-guided pseudouridylation complex pseudouridine synthase subunit Cbf5 [Candidatus Heimdallarchaeota archaeon]